MYSFKTGSVVSLLWLHRKSSLRQGARHPYLQEIPDVATPMVLVPHHPWSRYCYYLGLFFPNQTTSNSRWNVEGGSFPSKSLKPGVVGGFVDWKMALMTFSKGWSLLEVMLLNVDVKHPKRMHQICRLRWKSLFPCWLLLLDKALLGKCSND